MQMRRYPLRPPAPGVYRDVPMETYHQWAAISASMLKQAGGRLRSFRYWLNEDPEAPGAKMRMGTGLHAVVLEPERAREAVVEVPGLKPGSPAHRWQEAAEGRPGRHILPEGGYGVVSAMAERLRATARLGDVIDACRDRELSLVYDDPRVGCAMLRCRIDAVLRSDEVVGGGPLPGKWAHYHEAGDVIIDVKGTRSCEDGVFSGDVYRLGYHVAAALYRRIYEGVVGRKVSAVVLAACEWDRPHETVAYVVGEDFEAIGRAEADEILRAITRAAVTGNWSDDEVVDLVDMEPPGWVVRRFEDGRKFGGGR
jgi:hypothetical protein